MDKKYIDQTLSEINSMLTLSANPLFYPTRNRQLNSQFVYGAFLFMTPSGGAEFVNVDDVLAMVENNDPQLQALKVGIAEAEITQQCQHKGSLYFSGKLINDSSIKVTKTITEKFLISDYNSKLPFCWEMLGGAKNPFKVEIYEVDYLLCLLGRHPVLLETCGEIIVDQLCRILKQPANWDVVLYDKLLTLGIKTLVHH